MVNVEIKYFSDEIEKLRYVDYKSDTIDLCAAEDVEFRAGEYKLIPLGVAMKLPDGFEAHIYPRDSTYKDFGLIQANSVGIIDNTYNGDNDQWMYPAIAFRDVIIRKNDRICQFRVIRNQPEINFCEVDNLRGRSRGDWEVSKASEMRKIEVPICNKILFIIKEAIAYFNIWKKIIRNL